MIYIGKINKNGKRNDENGLLLYYSNDNYKSDLYIGSFINGEMIGYVEYYCGLGHSLSYGSFCKDYEW